MFAIAAAKISRMREIPSNRSLKWTGLLIAFAVGSVHASDCVDQAIRAITVDALQVSPEQKRLYEKLVSDLSVERNAEYWESFDLGDVLHTKVDELFANRYVDSGYLAGEILRFFQDFEKYYSSNEVATLTEMAVLMKSGLFVDSFYFLPEKQFHKFALEKFDLHERLKLAVVKREFGYQRYQDFQTRAARLGEAEGEEFSQLVRQMHEDIAGDDNFWKIVTAEDLELIYHGLQRLPAREFQKGFVVDGVVHDFVMKCVTRQINKDISPLNIPAVQEKYPEILRGLLAEFEKNLETHPEILDSEAVEEIRKRWQPMLKKLETGWVPVEPTNHHKLRKAKLIQKDLKEARDYEDLGQLIPHLDEPVFWNSLSAAEFRTFQRIVNFDITSSLPDLITVIRSIDQNAVDNLKGEQEIRNLKRFLDFFIQKVNSGRVAKELDEELRADLLPMLEDKVRLLDEQAS